MTGSVLCPMQRPLWKGLCVYRGWPQTQSFMAVGGSSFWPRDALDGEPVAVSLVFGEVVLVGGEAE